MPGFLCAFRRLITTGTPSAPHRLLDVQEVSRAAYAFLALQLVIGSMCVVTLGGQTFNNDQAVTNERLSLQQGFISERLHALEALNIGPKLAAIEQTQNEVHELKLLIVGMLITSVGGLIVNWWERKEQKRGRG